MDAFSCYDFKIYMFFHEKNVGPIVVLATMLYASHVIMNLYSSSTSYSFNFQWLRLLYSKSNYLHTLVASLYFSFQHFFQRIS